LQRSGKPHDKEARLMETLDRFRDQHELLSTERGRATWSAINRLAGQGVGEDQS